MNIKTKFKMGDKVSGKYEAHSCGSCGNKIDEKIEVFEVDEITIRLFSFRDPDITYSGPCGLSGYFGENELKKVK